VAKVTEPNPHLVHGTPVTWSPVQEIVKKRISWKGAFLSCWRNADNDYFLNCYSLNEVRNALQCSDAVSWVAGSVFWLVKSSALVLPKSHILGSHPNQCSPPQEKLVS